MSKEKSPPSMLYAPIVAVVLLILVMIGGVYGVDTITEIWLGSTATVDSVSSPIIKTPTHALPPAAVHGSTWLSPVDGMTLVYIPAGEFEMGTDELGADELPVHMRYLEAYWIDQTEVTNRMYAFCVAAGRCDPPTSNTSYTRPSYYGNPQFDNYPVTYVDWQAASAYCAWAGRRLPTEAEWEKAASWDEVNQRKTRYPWGDAIDCSLANYDNCLGDTTAVACYPDGRSPYGLYDMAGNVWEWVADWYDVYPGGDPDTSETFGMVYRMMRGGTWDENNTLVRSDFRVHIDPGYTDVRIGFRCAASP